MRPWSSGGDEALQAGEELGAPQGGQGADDGQPIRSRHGLTFAPRADLATAAPGLDRLLVPGADAARRAVAGMVVLGPVESLLLNPLGWAAVAELAVAVSAPFVVLFPPLWLGALSATGLLLLGHVLMLFTIAAAMLRRHDEDTLA